GEGPPLRRVRQDGHGGAGHARLAGAQGPAGRRAKLQGGGTAAQYQQREGAGVCPAGGQERPGEEGQGPLGGRESEDVMTEAEALNLARHEGKKARELAEKLYAVLEAEEGVNMARGLMALSLLFSACCNRLGVKGPEDI